MGTVLCNEWCCAGHQGDLCSLLHLFNHFFLFYSNERTKGAPQIATHERDDGYFSNILSSVFSRLIN